MVGRMDLVDAVCPSCNGTGRYVKNRRRTCMPCGGTGKVSRCTNCGGIYGVSCRDTVLDQAHCGKPKEEVKEK